MTLKNLLNEVYSLGFERESYINSAFLTASNHALRTIFSERTQTRGIKIITQYQKPVLHIPVLYHKGGEHESIAIFGEAYSFKVCGEGEVEIYEKGAKRKLPFKDTYKEMRGRLSGEGEMVLGGECSYVVRDLAVFEKRFSSANSDIPVINGSKEYIISDMVSDFLSLTKAPEDIYGRPLACYSCEGGKLILPYDYSGEITVYYNRQPAEIIGESENEVIDIGNECRHLLPLLTASYLWLDDDADKAQYYMALYKEGMTRINRYEPRETSNSRLDVLGWA